MYLLVYLIINTGIHLDGRPFEVHVARDVLPTFV